jgi:2-dehydro-3-deoxygluconokinase
MVDVLTFGETMLRLSPPGDDRLDTATSFDVAVGGAESNVAVAAARLGRTAGWLSRVPDSPLGRRVTDELRRHGVTPFVATETDGRQPTYYLESGDEPRGTDVHYDRVDGPLQSATPADLPAERVESATVLHTSGITPALSGTLADTTATLLDRASEAGATVSFDLNYRSKLWDTDAAGETVGSMLDSVDLLFVPERDAGPVLGIDGDASAVARTVAERYGIGTVVVTRGADGALARADGRTVEQGTYPAGDAHAVGTGDAFVGGFLARYVETGAVDEALQWGAATAALKRSIPGDMALVTPSEVRDVVSGDAAALDR